jgi:hypothetical protein
VLATAACASPPDRDNAQATVNAASPMSGPAWVVEQFYGRPTFPQLDQYITGEFAEHYRDAGTMGERLPRGAAVRSRALRQDDTVAVFATAIRDRHHTRDWYTFLQREDGRWKIAAVRTLALPPIAYVLPDSMRARFRAKLLPDSLVAVMERMALTVASDSALSAYVLVHQADLLTLAQRTAAIPELDAISVDGQVSPSGTLRPQQQSALVDDMRALNIGAIIREPEYPQCTFLKVGGEHDDHVGFLYAPPGCTLPALTANRFIYLEQAGNHWYVYKTT